MFRLDTFGWPGAVQKALPRHGAALELVRKLATALAKRSDAELRVETAALRARAIAGDDDFAPDAIALAAEAIRRVHHLTPYDVQLVAGLVLAGGRLAEMATGEGKTLVALLPAFCFALRGRGVHVATVNSYLAERDRAFARGPLELLGLSVALLQERAPHAEKRAAYAADVTYGVGTEFGFDYLRDQLALRAHAAQHRRPRYHDLLLGRTPPSPSVVQRGQAFAVIDEADSVLIDEARSPLIISLGVPMPSSTPEIYRLATQLAAEFRLETDYTRDPQSRAISLTPEGRQRAFDSLPENLLSQLRRPWPAYVEKALRARLDFHRDVHYLVADGKAIIVDEFTGRPCPERTWRDGLHQAVEAAARITITEENSSEATITRPAYFRLYGRVCGMTGTAREAAHELRTSYSLATSLIPLHRPCQRRQLPDRIFATRAAKLAAVVRDVQTRHDKGQPVLVGTRTVEASEALADLLAGCGFPFFLLNARQDADEARIIEYAGQPGTVTIATNMAGRGAHIPVPEESVRAGGLHVIGLELHESARIDRQLIGRAARQGQPGSCQFFLSLEDDLVQRHAPKVLARLRAVSPDAGGELPARCAAAIHRVQRRVETRDRTARSALAQHDRWLDELKQAL